MGFFAKLFGRKKAREPAENIPEELANADAAMMAVDAAQAAQQAQPSTAMASPGGSPQRPAFARTRVMHGGVVGAARKSAGVLPHVTTRPAATPLPTNGGSQRPLPRGAGDWLRPANAVPSTTPTIQTRAVPPAAKPQQRDVIDDVIDGLDAGFEALVVPGQEGLARSESPVSPQDDVVDAVIIDLFAAIASSYLQQVREFMLELSVGEPTKEWLEICVPSVRSISRASSSMGLETLADNLAVFQVALDLAGEAEGHRIRGQEREAILDQYAMLEQILPEAFRLPAQRGSCQPIIMHSLFLQVPRVGKVTIDKIYAAGLTSLDVLYKATVDDLVTTAGIDRSLAAAIFERFQEHKAEREAAPPEGLRSATCGQLDLLLQRLENHHNDFREAEATENGPRKRKARGARQKVLLQVNVALAQLGDVELIRHLERLAFDRKSECLSEDLDNGAQEDN